jgi:hypothetical protein
MSAPIATEEKAPWPAFMHNNEVVKELAGIKHYTITQRIKYAHSVGWRFKRRVFTFDIPVIPNDRDIHLDYAWRDIQRKQKTTNQHKTTKQ